MKGLIEQLVFFGFVTAWRLATRPTSRSPFLANATTEGVVRNPSAFGMTFGSPPSITATHEFVVPRSMPMTLPMFPSSLSVRLPRRRGGGAWPRSRAAGTLHFLGCSSANFDLDILRARRRCLGYANLE